MAKNNANTTATGKPKYFDGQFEDEEVLYVFRKHPIVMRKGLIYGSLGLLAGPLYTLILTYTHSANPPTMMFFYLSFLFSIALSTVVFFPFWMSWYFSVFVLTNQRFIQATQQGFFHRSVADIPLNVIQSINYDISGAEQTLLGFGTIVMQTYIGDSKLHYIHHPAKVQRKIAEFLRQEGIAPNPVMVRSREIEHEEV